MASRAIARDVVAIPAGGEAQHRVARAGELRLVGADPQVDELAPQRAEEQPAGDEALPVQRPAHRDHRRPGDDRLVEVEEGGRGYGVSGPRYAATPFHRHTPCVGSRHRCRTGSPHASRPCLRLRSALSPLDASRRRVPGGPSCSSPAGPPRAAPAPPSSPPPSPSLLRPLAGRRARRRPRRRPACRPRPARPAGRVPGVADWLAAAPDVPADALGRLEEPVGRRPRARCAAGRARSPCRAAELLAGVLAAEPRPVVVDCGRLDPTPTTAAARAGCSPPAPAGRCSSCGPCFLGAPPGAAAPLRPSGVVLVAEEGRALTRRRRRGRPRRAGRSPGSGSPSTVARAVDAGLLAARLPRTLARGPPPCRLTPLPTATTMSCRRPRRRRRRGRARRRRDGDRRARAAPAARWRRRRVVDGRRPTACTSASPGSAPLEPLLADPAVTEVMVNGPGAPVWVERAGPARGDRRRARPRRRRARRRADRRRRSACASTARSPLVDARLPDGSRVNVVVPPLAVDGPCVTIRRFGARPVPLDELCPPGVAELLVAAVRARLNIVAVGGTGAGKTTLLNALAGARPRRASASSPSRTPPSCDSPTRTSSGSSAAGRADGAGASRRSATSSATPCGCVPTASSSARSAAPRRSTSSRP